MKIYEFNDFRDFVKARVLSMGKSGRGEYRRIADHLGVHTTLISQCFRGDKTLSLENMQLLASYLGLNELETQYLLCLVQIEKSGTQKLKEIFQKQANQLKTDGLLMIRQLPIDRVLKEAEKTILYSDWYYTGVRILTSINKFNNASIIAEELDLPLKLTKKILDFLTTHNLCVEVNGIYTIGPQRTYLEPDSPYIHRYHSTWRLKAISNFKKITDPELSFTAPLSISENDFEKVSVLLKEFIGKVSQLVSETNPEKAVCLNIDWFQIRS